MTRALFPWQMVMMKNVFSEIQSCAGSLPVDVHYSHTTTSHGLSMQDSAVLHSCLTRKASKECVGHNHTSDNKSDVKYCTLQHIKVY